MLILFSVTGFLPAGLIPIGPYSGRIPHSPDPMRISSLLFYCGGAFAYIMHYAVQLPLDVHFFLRPQREPVHSLAVGYVGEHGFYYLLTPRV
jgi:hypothetical protein